MRADAGAGDRAVVMVGTHWTTRGGVSSVVCGYRQAGLFERWDLTYVATHRDGNALQKAAAALTGFVKFAVTVARRWPVIVHVHLSSRASFWRKLCIFEACHALSIPTILHLHGSEFMEFHDAEAGAIGRALIRRTFGRAREVIVLSEQWRTNVLRIMGAQSRSVRVLRNAVSVPSDLRPRATDDDAVEILFLGRLGTRKGVFDLLEALSGIDAPTPRWHLSCAGDGQIEQVRERARAWGIADRVSVLGWIDATERDRLLRRSAIFALPSYAEGLPMALLEAMAYGLAVVASPVGGIPEAVTSGREGYLVAAGDRPALRDCLKSLLQDPELRRRMGAFARERIVQDFSLQHAVYELGALYGELGARPADERAVGSTP
jgi:glycosyltransferase involved in cell wall biosynthesis